MLGGDVGVMPASPMNTDHGQRSARLSHARSRMVLFLCSPSAGFDTGGVYVVDGAQTAH